MSSTPSHFNTNVSCATYTKFVSLHFICILILCINLCLHCFQILLGRETLEALAVLDVPKGGAVVLAERLCAASHTVSDRCSVLPRSSVQAGPGSSRRTIAMSQTSQPAALRRHHGNDDATRRLLSSLDHSGCEQMLVSDQAEYH